MPKTSKPIVCICGSKSIKDLNIDRYLRPEDIGEIVTGGAIGVDILADNWAKQNNIEHINYFPQYKIYGGKYAPIKRDEEMVAFSDKLIAFWDGKSKGTKATIEFALEYGIEVELHLVEDR